MNMVRIKCYVCTHTTVAVICRDTAGLVATTLVLRRQC